MSFNTSGELWKGLTDLPAFLEALLFSVLLRKNGNPKKRKWSLEFAVVAGGLLLGTVVHCIEMNSELNKTIWVILYAFMYSMVWFFFRLLLEKLTGKVPHKAWTLAAVACYAGSCLVKVFIGRGDIYIFVLYAAPVAGVLTAECVRQGCSAVRERLVMSLLGLAIASQLLGIFWGSIGPVMGHVLVFAALLVLYDATKNSDEKSGVKG